MTSLVAGAGVGSMADEKAAGAGVGERGVSEILRVDSELIALSRFTTMAGMT